MVSVYTPVLYWDLCPVLGLGLLRTSVHRIQPKGIVVWDRVHYMYFLPTSRNEKKGKVPRQNKYWET